MTTQADELREAVARAVCAADAEVRKGYSGVYIQQEVEELWKCHDFIAQPALQATALYLRANARSLAQHDDTAEAWVEKIIGLIEEAGR